MEGEGEMRFPEARREFNGNVTSRTTRKFPRLKLNIVPFGGLLIAVYGLSRSSQIDMSEDNLFEKFTEPA